MNNYVFLAISVLFCAAYSENLNVLHALDDEALLRGQQYNMLPLQSYYSDSIGSGVHSVEEMHVVANRMLKTKQKKKKRSQKCNPQKDVKLADYSQWQEETGYWVGEYSLYKSDGDPYTSTSWPYPYAHYKGFITGNVENNAYRQRNVFLYDHLASDECVARNLKVVGDGICGVNGNTKVFFADQNATTCSNGNISGDYQGYFKTTTDLIGPGNAVLYQVFLKAGALGSFPTEDCLYQSQLTSFTKGPNGEQYRTRTAQGFQCFIPSLLGQPTYASYYREHKVDQDEFYSALKVALDSYTILEPDTCAWMDSPTGGVVRSPYTTPGFDACKQHLQQSFDIFA